MVLAKLKPKPNMNFSEPNDKEYATKLDIKLLHSELEKLEMRLIIKLGAMVAFWGSAVITLIKI
ncbi:MAG: hypothetical protein K0T99_04825 [Alphaproteobacteria bacterium]|nr:hypothetical protein [Alphaproteobacteria bacterium]